MENKGPFCEKALVIITGASRGYGLQLAKSISLCLVKNSMLVLVARNESALQRAIQEIKSTVTSGGVAIKGVLLDLSVITDMENVIEKSLHGIADISTYKMFMLIHNAGSIGDVSRPLADINDAAALSKYFNLNVLGVQIITSNFISMIKEISFKGNCFIINISSLCALQAFPGMGLYCVGKSARDMLFKVLAAENPQYKFLSWAPGPMPTDMLVQLSKSVCVKSTKAAFIDMVEKKTYVEIDESVKKLIGVIESNNFVSGIHLDYYDV